ncbi:hypothetical protein J4E86_004202 [Alternaria arbusti]|uniref:uncharacterized protein n=1 Tax=Alternaria arbusti TaxID=232088 RepID=UPI00221E9964|nr:uncharacterized protein J4E86_004202 [Alternaria arbusti]KAI4958598.1 hypothetical protein J4E86_004202 [Alternaria arbusti]
MHLELALVGLAALTAAMPLDKRGDDSANQAQDINYKEYAGYRPYYQYGDYSSPAEAEAAKMQQESAATNMKRDEPLSKQEVYDKYDKYESYGVYYENYNPYPASVEAEAAKMNAKMEKRHIVDMPKDMVDQMANNEKRDEPKEIQAAGDSWYQSYIPYSNYGKYGGAAEAEVAKAGCIMAASGCVE